MKQNGWRADLIRSRRISLKQKLTEITNPTKAKRLQSKRNLNGSRNNLKELKPRDR